MIEGRGCKPVNSIDIGLLNPSLKTVSHLLWSSYQYGAVAADANMLGNGVLGPFGSAWRKPGIALNSRSVMEC